MSGTVRQLNEARARLSLLAAGRLSRADLSRELGLTRATVSSIITTLIEAGEVIETEDDAGARIGRPSVQLRLNPDHAIFLGAYAGPARICLSAADYTGKIIWLKERPVRPGRVSPEEMADLLKDAVQEGLASGLSRERIAGLNVSVPGIVDLEGNILRAPPLNWKRTPFRRILTGALGDTGLDTLMNDANAFALAARKELPDEKLNDALYVLLEDGVGGCIFSGGKMILGGEGYAGEFGHVPVGRKGFTSLTGVDGVLENFISRQAILSRYRELGGEAGNFQDYLDQLEAGESRAAGIKAECVHYLARGIAVITALLNPQAVLIGGRVSAVLKGMEGELSNQLAVQLVPGATPPRISITSLGREGPAVGAALALHEKHLTFSGGLTVSSL